MKVAITGAAGFVGSNLAEACLKKGWTVVGIDNLSGAYQPMFDPVRVRHLPGKYETYAIDINDTSELIKILYGCEVVFHMAALPRVSFSVDYPLKADMANVHGTLSVLDAARLAQIKRVIFSCSSSIYGGVGKFPTPETETANPKSPYALHKYTGSEYCRLYSELHGVDTCSLVYFNVFGPYQLAGARSAYATVVPAFLKAAMNDESCRINGDGLQSRDLCYIDNVVQANLLAAQHQDNLNGELFNIACGDSISVNEVFDKIQKISGKSLKKYRAPSRPGDPRKSHADISKAQKVLGYQPEVFFDEGLEKTYSWWAAGCPIKA